MAASRGTDWLTLGLLLGMYGLLIGNFALYQLAPLPLAVHVLIATAAIHLAFTIWHEAVHRNVSPRLWVNNAVGVLGMLPYLTPYFMQRWIHLEHHTRLNEREDPNFVYTDGPFWKIPLRYPRALGYAPGSVDGRYGAQTRSAVETFEREQGWPVSGRISELLRKELLERVRSANASEARLFEATAAERSAIRERCSGAAGP